MTGVDTNVLARYFSPDTLAARVTPAMRKATYKVPHSGTAASTAANFALHLASC